MQAAPEAEAAGDGECFVAGLQASAAVAGEHGDGGERREGVHHEPRTAGAVPSQFDGPLEVGAGGLMVARTDRRPTEPFMTPPGADRQAVRLEDLGCGAEARHPFPGPPPSDLELGRAELRPHDEERVAQASSEVEGVVDELSGTSRVRLTRLVDDLRQHHLRVDPGGMLGRFGQGQDPLQPLAAFDLPAVQTGVGPHREHQRRLAVPFLPGPLERGLEVGVVAHRR